MPRMPTSVLLIEDDATIRVPLAELLMREGYEAFGVANGREALDWLQQHDRPSLILLDLMMPVMSGVQFLAARRNTPLAEIPVVVLTAWISRCQDNVRRDVDGVLAKPIDTDKLVAIVARYCSAAPNQSNEIR